MSNQQAEGASRETREDINAPPQDSSDERETAVFEAEGYGEASDDSEFEAVKVGKATSTPRDPASSPQTANTGSPHHSIPCQNYEKRESEHWLDDSLGMSFQTSHLKRHGKGIGYGKTKAKPKLKNIHKTSPIGLEQKRCRERKTSLSKGKTAFKFIKPPTEGLLTERKCTDLLSLIDI